MEERHRCCDAGSFYLHILSLLQFFLLTDGRTDGGHVVRSVRAKGHSNTYEVRFAKNRAPGFFLDFAGIEKLSKNRHTET